MSKISTFSAWIMAKLVLWAVAERRKSWSHNSKASGAVKGWSFESPLKSICISVSYNMNENPLVSIIISITSNQSHQLLQLIQVWMHQWCLAIIQLTVPTKCFDLLKYSIELFLLNFFYWKLSSFTSKMGVSEDNRRKTARSLSGGHPSLL